MTLKSIMDVISVWLIPLIIIAVLTFGLIKKIPVYEVFIDGAKDGLKITVEIIPYLLAIMVAVGMLRASGAIELLQTILGGILNKFDVPVDVLPVMIVRSLSGSAVLGLFSDIASQHDVESYTTKLAAIMVGSSETTFYILAVYFGAVGIKKLRYALLVGLLADAVSMIVAITVCSLMY